MPRTRTSNRTETREELIQAGAEIIAEKGFNTTGIEAVLQSAGVPKGSFYYYFPSKDDFGLAVIDHVAREYEQKLDGFLKDPRIPPLTRIRNYLEAGIATMADERCSRGCPIGNLSQEMASQNDKFRARLERVFRTWKMRFAECLADAQRTGELPADANPEQLAEFLLAGWEGATLRAKVTRSVKPMRDFVEVLFNKVLVS